MGNVGESGSRSTERYKVPAVRRGHKHARARVRGSTTDRANMRSSGSIEASRRTTPSRHLYLALDRPEPGNQWRQIARHQFGMPELIALGPVEVAGDLHVRRPAGEQVIELVRVGLIFRVLAWRARDAERVPLLEQCTLDTRFCRRPIQTGHVLS